ncbi:MAG: SDR family NAD(P)-dependent oxidoreductase [Acidobacteriaceae bacterium]
MSESEATHHEKGIAIVGLAGRFPGASTVKDFWRNLTEGVEAIHFASAEELTAAGVDPGLISHPDYVPAGGRVHEPDYFDASFFGFSAREAEIIDPQQRVFLECAWDALEDAGCDPSSFPGSIGVFAGAGMNSYGVVNLFSNPDVIESAGGYQVMVGNDKDFLCSRVAYKLNLRGPAIGVQTACSTSLVAVQMAFESLLRRECDVALAGGVSIPIPQHPGYLYIPGMILSPDGHCRAFDAAASGTVPGGGAGIAVLKRLDDAIADQDHIYAVIRGAAVNNDGSAKVGYSAPSVEGQSAVIRKAMQMAGFSPESVGYIEAHGTGTEVGDPIEIAALSKVFESATVKPESCRLGSVKTNIGHLDTAAGIAGLIKTALAVEHRTIPATLHFTQTNPLIDFKRTPFVVNASLTTYDEPGPFRAGVSSFGIGGTNAHVVLEEAPLVHSDPLSASQLIVLSAKTSSALDARSSQLLGFLEENPAANLADIAFTLQKGRQAFQYRRVLVARDVAALKVALEAPPSQSPRSQSLRTDKVPAESQGTVFLFPGQGSQYVNMGLDLYRTTAVFRDSVDRCCQLLTPHLGLDLRSILFPAPSQEQEAEARLSQTAITQPALFVIEYSMARLFMECGIQPAAMIGHSVGEYVAACLAGVFSLEDAITLIAARGRLIQALPSGAMLAVSLSESDLLPMLSPETSIAAVNSPLQTVASGTAAAIDALETRLQAKKIDCRRLHTSHAFHSPMMDGIVGEFVRLVAGVKLNPPNIPYLSNVSGTWVTGSQATNPAYWGSHIRNTVQFSNCLQKLLRDSDPILLEVGPGETLLSLTRQHLEPRSARPMIPSMRPRQAVQDDRETWLTAMGRLWLLNILPDWDALHTGERRTRVPLPTYPFERQRYWVEPKKAKEVTTTAMPLKQADIADWFYVPSWTRTVPALRKKSRIDANLTWLLLAEDGPFSEKLASELSSYGQIVRVRTGERFHRASAGLYEIDPANREDYVALLQDLQASGQWPDRVVHAWWPEADGSADLQSALDRGVLSAMFLIQAAEEQSPNQQIEFNVVSERAYSVSGEAISSPIPAALNSFCGVIPIECPNIRSRVIDLDLLSNSASAIRQLVGELVSPPSNEIIAYRGSSRWVQRFEPTPFEKSLPEQTNVGSIPLRAGGTYIITGGLGGVGLVLAQHLARTAQARILLTSRTPPPPATDWKALLEAPETPDNLKTKIQGVQSIEALGGKPLISAVDTVDLASMRQLLASVRADYGPIHGIIHAAGVAGAGMMQAKSREEVLAVLSPKVQGTEWIRECIGVPELDFVLLCSSISAVIPSIGLSDYAAANAYLDGFAAAYDDPSGTRVLSVNWDTWRDVGMAVHMQLPAALAHLREDNLKHAIASAEAVDVFDRVLFSPVSQVLVSTRDFARLQRLTSQAIADLRDSSNSPKPSPAVSVHSRPDSLDDFVPAGDEIESFIVATWQELLGIEPIGIHDDFFKLGGHSLLGTQVLARVRERFKINLSLRIVFEAATPAELAQQVRLMSWASTSTPTASALEREEIEI